MPSPSRTFDGVQIGKHGDQPIRRLIFDEPALTMFNIAARVGISPSQVGAYARGFRLRRRDDIRAAAGELLGRELTHDECWTNPNAAPPPDDGRR